MVHSSYDELLDAKTTEASPSSNHSNVLPNILVDFSLELLTKPQRTVLVCIVVTLLTIALCGNCATVIVNVRRNMRPLFKSCLISLAFSDLLTSVFTSMAYISQLSTNMSLLWDLGDILCAVIPFVTTMAILANSMTLVSIALDRYMAVVKVLKGSWEPKSVFCATCAVLIWGLAAGISSPMMTSYFIIDVYVIITDPNNKSIGVSIIPSQMCVNEKHESAYYYVIVFSTVFVPLFLSFLWLNATIAAEIWSRRNPIEYYGSMRDVHSSSQKDDSSDKKTSETNTASSEEIAASNEITKKHDNKVMSSNAPKSIPSSSKNCRKTRQLRMFKVIIVIIGVFFVCRLPTWIFLLIKLNNNLTENIHWLLHFIFGILSLLNCALNPFIYTFLTETIQYSTLLKNRFKRHLNCFSIVTLRNHIENEPECRNYVNWGLHEGSEQNAKSKNTSWAISSDRNHGGVYLGTDVVKG